MSEKRTVSSPYRLDPRQSAIKRSFDLLIAVPAFVLTLPITFAALLVSTIDTKESGLFTQQRIGRNGLPIKVHKIRTMRTSKKVTTTVTSSSDTRITRTGAILRKAKIDELPQLWDVIVGSMSLVGPRPDVSGWADQLTGSERSILSIRPGVTGPASIKYRNEEEILAGCSDPESYNRDVIWPDKVQMNLDYLRSWTLMLDILMIKYTILRSSNGQK